MRSSGIYMSIRALPSPGGNGTLGQEAREFIDWLASAGFSVWHMPFTGPVNIGGEYLSLTCGDPMFIDMRTLNAEGLLSQPPENFVPHSPENAEAAHRGRHAALKLSFSESRVSLQCELEEFVRLRPEVANYAVFMAVRNYFGGRQWQEWNDLSIRYMEENALNHYRRILADDVDYFIYLQYLFYRQWKSLKAYANFKGVKLMCDMPLYAPVNSCDVWAHAELFQCDQNHLPLRVPACAPCEAFNDGELWQYPAYNWKALSNSAFAWFINRFKSMAEQFDIINLVSFNDYASCYSVKSHSPTARVGIHEKVPGRALFYNVKRQLPKTEFVAEIDENLTARGRRLLRFCGFAPARSLAPRRGKGDSELGFVNDAMEHSAIFSSTRQPAVLWWSKLSYETQQSISHCLPARSTINESLVEAALGSMADMATVSVWDAAAVVISDGSAVNAQIPKSTFTHALALDLRNMNEFFQRTATENQ